MIMVTHQSGVDLTFPQWGRRGARYLHRDGLHGTTVVSASGLGTCPNGLTPLNFTIRAIVNPLLVFVCTSTFR